MCEENHICNLSTCTCENDKYLEKLVYETVVRCDEIIDATQSEPINFNYKKTICKTNLFYFNFGCPFFNYHIAIDNLSHHY